MESDLEVPSPSRVSPLGRVFLFLLVLLILALIWRSLPVSDWVNDRLYPFLENAGLWSYVLYYLIYVVAVVLLVPGTVLTLSGGYLFGPWIGFLLSSLSATTGASIAFLLGRSIARGTVRDRVDQDQRFRAIDREVEVRGAKVVLLLRLSPIVPFNLLNYALGLTGIRFWAYFLASWVGMLPGTVVLTFIGSSASGEAPADLGFWGWVVVVLTTLTAMAYMIRLASHALEQTRTSDDTPAAPETQA